MLKRLISAVLFIATASVAHFGQQLPNTIRGYKLYDRGTVVRDASRHPHTATGPSVSFGSVNPASVSLTGVTLTTTATISNIGGSGTIDFLMFRDIRVNGLPVEIAEYRVPFRITETSKSQLIGPIELFISNLTIAHAAYKELIGSKPRWEVSGTLLVFGQFRKFGFNFKKVVPVRLQITVDNPLPRC